MNMNQIETYRALRIRTERNVEAPGQIPTRRDIRRASLSPNTPSTIREIPSPTPPRPRSEELRKSTLCGVAPESNRPFPGAYSIIVEKRTKK